MSFFGKTLLTQLCTLSLATLTYSVFAQEKTASREVARGSYSVPVQDETLRESANFEIEYKIHERNEIPVKMSYQLPLGLTGTPTTIRIQATEKNQTQWRSINERGPRARGTCQFSEDNKQFNCQLSYKNIAFNVPAAEEALRSQFGQDVAELGRRMVVAKAFRSEPGGVVSINRTAYPRK